MGIKLRTIDEDETFQLYTPPPVKPQWNKLDIAVAILVIIVVICMAAVAIVIITNSSSWVSYQRRCITLNGNNGKNLIHYHVARFAHAKVQVGSSLIEAMHKSRGTCSTIRPLSVHRPFTSMARYRWVRIWVRLNWPFVAIQTYYHVMYRHRT